MIINNCVSYDFNFKYSYVKIIWFICYVRLDDFSNIPLKCIYASLVSSESTVFNVFPVVGFLFIEEDTFVLWFLGYWDLGLHVYFMLLLIEKSYALFP